MTGYVFVQCVNDYRTDFAPANEEGFYFNLGAAIRHLCELNRDSWNRETTLQNMFGTLENYCKSCIIDKGYIPFGWYGIEKVEIKDFPTPTMEKRYEENCYNCLKGISS